MRPPADGYRGPGRVVELFIAKRAYSTGDLDFALLSY